MKKKLINLLLTLSMAFAVIGFVGCKDDKPDDTQSSVESTIPPSSEQPPEKENFTGITFPDKTVTYNGNAHSLELVGVPTFATVDYDKETSYTNAGTYTVKATVTADNYNALELSATLTIEKATVEGISFAGETYTYDGTEKSLAITGNLPDGVTVAYENNDQTNAGEYTVMAIFTVNDNYNAIADKTATLKINKATYDMSGVTYENTTATYDGQPHTITVGNLPEGVTASVEQKSCINADSYDLLVTFTGNSTNYNPIDSVTKTLTIEKATVEGIAFNGATYTYDGTEKSLAITGNLPDGVTVAYENNDQTNASEYTVTAKFTVNDNYNAIADKTAMLTIEKKELTVAFSGATNLTYTGEVQKTISATPTNLVNGDSVQITLTYSGEMIEKGDYTVTASIDEQNYKLTQNNTIAVKISRAVHTLTFKQEGFADVTLTVNDLENITARIPEPQKVTGYDIVWVWGDKDYTSVTDSWTITAQKTAIKYTITYINSGTSVENTTTYTVEDEDILLNIPENGKGMVFDGWYDENEKLIESIDTATASDRTITAKWIMFRIEQAVGFTIDYTPTIPTISITIANAETALTLDDKITVSRGCVLELYIPTIADGNKQLTNDLFDLQIGNNEGYLVVRNAQLGRSQSYKLNVYRLDIKGYTFMNGESTHHSGTIEETYAVYAPETPTREVNGVAYTFVGWSVNGKIVEFPYTVTEDTVFTAEYIPTEYTIILDLQGGSLAQTTLTYNFETATFDLQKPTRDYYTFAGWKYNGNPISQITQGSYGDKTITATWTTIPYVIAYEMNEGTNADNPISYTVEDEIVLKTPTRDYYDFVEWQYAGKRIEKISVGSHKDMTIAAIWIPTVYQIFYEMNEGTNAENPASYTVEDEIILKEPTRDSYDFIEWQYKGEKIEKISIGSYGDITLTAIWTPTVYQIFYEMNEGTNTDNPTTYTVEDEIVLQTPTREHYDFVEWQYKGEKIEQIPVGSYGDKTITAIWTPHVYTVSYNFDGGIEIEQPITGIHIEQQFPLAINAQRTHKDNAVFDGWYLDEEFTIPAVQLIGAKDTVIYVKWIQATEGLQYEGNAVTDYTGTATEVIIAEWYNGMQITAVGASAFEQCGSVTSIIIPDCVNTIGSSAFFQCRYLTSIVIGNGVTTIGASAINRERDMRKTLKITQKSLQMIV